MNKLDAQQVEEYFAEHVPYRLGILLAHFRMTHPPRAGDQRVVNACFVASLVTGRMFLNMLGIGLSEKNRILLRFDPRNTDVCVDDLGGVLMDPAKVSPQESSILVDFLIMANQAAAHFTVPIHHNWPATHQVIWLICEYLKKNLYDPTGRTIEPI